ncbi:hypothetical protein GGS20DRAFT_383955 [Poronia punctata]|nr:hypothetical protein GGS20DRAFT_383955 [Poronia punctata]
MSWIEGFKVAGSLGLWTIQSFGSLLYMISTPLRWPLYYLYTAVIFLLSPLWLFLGFGLSIASFALDMIVRLKYLYVYVACAALVGLCAGVVLHGTSSFFFVLFGLNTPASDKQRKLGGRYFQNPPRSTQFLRHQGWPRAYDPDSESASLSGEGLDRAGWSGLDIGWRRAPGPRDNERMDLVDAIGKQRVPLRTPDFQSRRRRKVGFMAPTIHEESSESDFS